MTRLYGFFRRRNPAVALALAFAAGLAVLAAGSPSWAVDLSVPPQAPDKAEAEIAIKAPAEEWKRPETFPEWMAKALDGDPEAQCNVGVFYVNGESIPQNFHLGVEWLGRSADQGFSYAQFVLAGLYTRGVGDLPPDTLKAYFWASLSAAATDLPEKHLRKAAKIRDANRDRLTIDELRQAQDMTRQWWEKHTPSG